EFIPNSYWSVWDKETSKSFFAVMKGSPISDHPFPVGWVNKAPANRDESGNYHIELPLFAIRPLDPILGCTRNPWGKEPTGPIELSMRMLGESKCAVIGQWFGLYRREIWVDQNTDCSIRRYLISKKDGRTFYQIDATFTRDDKAGW